MADNEPEDDYELSEAEDDIKEIDSPVAPAIDHEDDLIAETPAPLPQSELAVKDQDGRTRYLEFVNTLPYACESIEDMDSKLDVIVQHITEAIEARDYDVGLPPWTHRLEVWLGLKCSIKRELRARLVNLYYSLVILDGLEPRLIEMAANMTMLLIESKKRIDIDDIVLPWKPLYQLIDREMFPKKRQTGITGVINALLKLAVEAQRFFAPHESHEMLSTFLPRFDGSDIDSILAAQTYLCFFLPLSHPTEWLSTCFSLWECFRSSVWDDSWIGLMARLAELHVNPHISSPHRLERIRHQALHNPPGTVDRARIEFEDSNDNSSWRGIQKDVGIFTTKQWSWLMSEILQSMQLPVGGTGNKATKAFLSMASGSDADSQASRNVLGMGKVLDKSSSYGTLIVYSMFEDGLKSTGTSVNGTPLATPSTPNLSANKANGHAKQEYEQTYLAGSKALDSLAKFIQATESFFHPSNYGIWSLALAKFVQTVASEFLRRWTNEQKPSCKTPQAWKLTQQIKREFVLTLRTVALLSMYAKDPLTSLTANATLRCLALLDPELLIPSVLDRAFPALENVIETHRITANLAALGVLASVIVSREIAPFASKNLVPLLELCVPGIDLNDPLKTVSTCMFITSALSIIGPIDDLTRPDIANNARKRKRANSILLDGDGREEAGTPAIADVEMSTVQSQTPGEHVHQLSRAAEDELLKESTSGFPDWVFQIMKAIFNLMNNLPEPGKGGKTGGRAEDQIISTLNVAMDAIVRSLSPRLFDEALRLYFDHVAHSPRANAARVVGSFTAAFARTDPAKTLAMFYHHCDRQIRLELESGATSNPSTSTASPMEADTAFQWHCYILTSCFASGGQHALPYEKHIISLVKLMVERCRSERGYSHVARLVTTLISSLSTVWTEESNPVENADFYDPDYLPFSHLYWGKTYSASEVHIRWHVPSEAELAFLMRIVEEIIYPAMAELEALVGPESRQKNPKIWANDFCRKCGLVKSMLAAAPSLVDLSDAPIPAGKPLTDVGDVPLDFVKGAPKCVTPVCLSKEDPRYQKIIDLRIRAAKMLLSAASGLRDNGAEDAIDSVKMIITTMKSLLLDYSTDRFQYASQKQAYEFTKMITRFSKHQKKHPRTVWVRRASYYHVARLRVNSLYRVRTEIDDQLIFALAELSLSPYVSVRKAAQKAVDSMVIYFDGTRTLLLQHFLNAIKPGTDPDVMKGALHVLETKSFSNFTVVDWRYTPTHILALLQCSHQEKPSIQAVVKRSTSDYVVRLAEPSTITRDLTSPGLVKALADLHSKSHIKPDPATVAALVAACARRVEAKNSGCATLVPQLLSTAEDSSTHWRYKTLAARFLRALIRRDQPLDPQMSDFVSRHLISELPSMRIHAILSMSKLLHFLKLRSLAKDNVSLYVPRKVRNPLKKDVDLPQPLPETFTDNFLRSLTGSMTDPETKLSDRQASGWLVWDKTITVYDPPDQNKPTFVWEDASSKGLAAIEAILSQPSWWRSFSDTLSQEQSRDYLAADQTIFLKSVFQVFEDRFLDNIFPIIEEKLFDSDRHKQRAGSELLSGMVRGSKHWPLCKQERVWGFLRSVLPRIVESITPDSQVAIEMLFEYILMRQDPRRNKVIIDFILQLPVDLESSEAFGEAKKAYLLGCLCRSLSWHFQPWAQAYIEKYWEAIKSPFQEIRSAVSANLKSLTEIPLHPSFASVQQLITAGQQDGLLLDVNPDFINRIRAFKQQLHIWRAERQPSSSGSQIYDTASLCVLQWILQEAEGHRVTAVYPFVQELLPEIYDMCELLDNTELRNTAQNVLGGFANLTYPPTLVRPVLNSLIMLLKTATSWRVRLDVLPVLQVFFFHQLFSIESDQIMELMETLVDLLQDKSLEVREAAAASLSGIIRCSQRHAILSLRDRFLMTVRTTKIPRRRTANGQESANYQQAILEAHSGVLGAAALINAHPYDVPSWLPPLLLEVMGMHVSSPAPIGPSVRQCLADFKTSHQDSWVEDQKAFTEEQLSELNDLLIPPSSYYA